MDSNSISRGLSLADHIANAYDQLFSATGRYYTARERYQAGKATHDAKRLTAIVSGEIQGKNADIRKAAEREVLAPEYAVLCLREADMLSAQTQYESAKVDVAWVRARLELEALPVDESFTQISVGVIEFGTEDIEKAE